MFNQYQSKVKVGDKVLVALGGEIKELEVVKVSRQAVRTSNSHALLRLLNRKSMRVTTVQLPNGKTMDCRYFPISHQ